VGRCADKGSTVGHQEGVGNVLDTLAGLLGEAGVRGEVSRGEVSNGKITFSRRNADGDDPDIYVSDEEGTHETRLTATKWTEDGPTWSPDVQKIAFSEEGSD